ncbi:MAG: hypothetical protein IKB20_00875 [Clostridia bacterium]|nr:hypothetical protein [Clostridia bacterium]
MSKFFNKAVKKPGVISILVAAILAAAIAVAVICGLTGNGVFNESKLLEDCQTITVTVDQTTYLTKLDKVEEVCEKAFGDTKVAYTLKGEMSGADNELIYVFDKDEDLKEEKKALEDAFAALVNGEWNGSFITVSANSEEVGAVLARNYVLRGVIAGAVMMVLVFAYVSLRHNLGLGLLALRCMLVGTVLSAMLIALFRIPVTVSVSYVFAVAALLSALTTVFVLNKFRANKETEDFANEEVLTFAALAAAALVVIGAVATGGVRWFAVSALLALIVAAFIGLIYAPARCLEWKAVQDKKPVKGAYVGAKKTSVKAKKAPVQEATVETPVAQEAPVEETVEETAEEPVEAPVEEVEEAAEEPVEE